MNNFKKIAVKKKLKNSSCQKKNISNKKRGTLDRAQTLIKIFGTHKIKKKLKENKITIYQLM